MNPRPLHDIFENEIYLNGGLTYDPAFGFMSDSLASLDHFGRYIVGVENVHIIDGDISPRKIKDMINHASYKRLLIGAWKDSESGLTHWDYVKAFHSKELALQWAESGNEIAIYDSVKKVEIRL